MRAQLPTGTVTFLFTDVEGSTKLLQRLGDAVYAEALAEHRRLLRGAFAANEGVEIDTQGDAFFVAFPTAPAALDAARDALEALDAGPIRVRIGVHTGTPVVTPEGYVGEDVHRAARIAAAGHGGQVLVSASTAALVPADAFGLQDLGEHRFKDLARPERVYQLGAERFPPIRSLSPSNLPAPATPFVGRESELAQVGELLAEPTLRLLTLTGPGGTGKTRLAIQAAADASERFPGGLWWVALAPITDPSLVLSEIANSLGVEEQADAPLVETLADRHGADRTLVVLDNAEHLLPGLASEIAPLTHDGGASTFLVTSRERLRLEAEREFAVPSMTSEDAEAFLLARAGAVGVRIEPSPALFELAGRLDRLPLAMQLAIARLRLFSVEQLLQRLSQRLDLPGERDADPRQRTLRATIAWSHDLLEPGERTLFRRLAVFAGGATLEAIEEVCEAETDLVLSLVDKSLVRRRDDAPEPRFWMLETIREFAAERLEEVGEVEALPDAHARWYLTWAQRWDDEVHRVGDRRPLFAKLDIELDNVRRALGWAEERSDAPLLQGLAGALRLYWTARGPYREGRRWLELAYRQPHEDPASVVRLLDGLSGVAYRQADYELALRTADEALPLARSTGDEGEIFGAITNVANALSALRRLDEAIDRYDEVLQMARRGTDPIRLAVAIVNRGDTAAIARRYDEAATLLREGIDVARAHGVRVALVTGLLDLATVCFQLGEDDDAVRYAIESVESEPATSDASAIALVVLAGVQIRRGDRPAGARLLGASEAVRSASGYAFEPNEQTVVATIEEEMGDALQDVEVRAAYDEGRALDPEVAAALVFET
jgi:predicted ATPase/class 3 adenylate cyclase